MNKYLILSLLLVVFSCQQKESATAELNLIPKPNSVETGSGNLDISAGFNIVAQNMESETAENLLSYLKKAVTVSPSGKKLQLVLQPARASVPEPDEAYWLKVDKTGVRISAHSMAGLFYGVQSLIQLSENQTQIPFVKIEDAPRFVYRGLHIDASRHFVSLDFLKKQIDRMASLKLNRFHWHFTDGPGWRIEIKKYPELTGIAAWRMEPTWKEWWNSGRKYVPEGTPGAYGGYYTQDEARELVRYAAERHITVIPEIEMLGHAQAVLAAYPELACTKGPFEVWKQWGVSEEIFCPKEETFKFLEDVLDEVIPLFPYQYIHIGGDEAPKIRWKQSEFCQSLIKKLGLKDEEALQSYFITRMEKYINAKGKKIIGWDEILQGGLAPNATVMSWTGIEGGIYAAKTGHKAIMTPTSTNYFDYYQGNPDTEPIAIGGDVRLQKVYNFNPIPKELTEEQAKFIWGTQGNLWTEYILDFKHVQHMIFPRMMALSEVAWGTSKPSEYKNFENRVIEHFKILDQKGIHYSDAIFEVEGKVVNKNGVIFYELTSAKDSKNIRYTIDGSEPRITSNVYSEALPIHKTQTIKSAYFENGKKISATNTQDFNITKSTGKSIKLQNSPTEAYSTGGANALVDGIRGNMKNYGKNWLGFSGNNVVATINLGNQMEVSSVSFNSLERQGSWIYLPKSAKILVSNDGENFKEVKTISANEIQSSKGITTINFPKQKAKFVKGFPTILICEILLIILLCT